jgi:hypothetical protein
MEQATVISVKVTIAFFIFSYFLLDNDRLVLKYVVIIKTNMLFIIKIYGAGCIILNILSRFNSLFMNISYIRFHLKFIFTVVLKFWKND